MGLSMSFVLFFIQFVGESTCKFTKIMAMKTNGKKAYNRRHTKTNKTIHKRKINQQIYNVNLTFNRHKHIQ